MKQLNVDMGLRSYNLNDGPEVIHFNPTSAEFANKILKTVERCQKISESSRVSESDDLDTMLAKLEKVSSEIRAAIDDAFDEPVSEKVFGKSGGVLSIADGLPVWMNFLMAVIDEIDANISSGDRKAGERMRYYKDKYEKKYAKYMRK